MISTHTLALSQLGELSSLVLVDSASLERTTLGEHEGSSDAIDVSKGAPGIPELGLPVTGQSVVLSAAVTSLVEGDGELAGAGVVVMETGSSGEVELGDGVASVILVDGEDAAITLRVLKVEDLDLRGLRGDGQGNGGNSGNNGELHFFLEGWGDA